MIGLKDQCFGVEVEMTGITREQAATALAAYFATDARYVGGAYDKWCVTDRDGKEWTVMSDSSIHGEQKIGSGYRATGDYRYRVEMVTPKLTYGIPTQKGLAVIYQRSEIAPNDIPLFPVQLIEAGAEAAIFVLLLCHLKKRVRGSELTAIYLLSYGVLRFVLEFFRGDSYRGMLYGLSLSQYISILGIVVGSVIVSASRRYTNSADYN